MSCEASPELAKKYQEGPAKSAPSGNFPKMPEVIPDGVNANHIFEPRSCPSTPAKDTKPRMWA